MMKNAESKMILLRLPNWLGDAVMISPAFELMKAHFKNAKFILVGTEASCGIYSRDLRVKKIFIDSTKKAQNGRKNGLKDRFLATKNFAREIRDNIGAIDIAVDFTNHFFSAILIYLTGAKIRVGYAKNIRTILLNKRVRFVKKLHQVASYMNLANEICGKKIIKNMSEISHKSTPLKLQNRAIKGFKSDDLLCIGINPGAAYGSAKRWEERYFVEIILHFLKNDCAVFVFGNDSVNLPANLAQNPHFHSLIGQTTITELVDYIASMDIFISNDSGPMHIAAAFRVPLIAIFGATDSRETSPWVDNAVILDKHLPCAPCKKRECPLKHHNCMKLITPDEVIERVNKIMR
ncbi:lipopolysaccharide heptosyltransferase II [Helicobacter sp. 23-1044]